MFTVVSTEDREKTFVYTYGVGRLEAVVFSSKIAGKGRDLANNQV